MATIDRIAGLQFDLGSVATVSFGTAALVARLNSEARTVARGTDASHANQTNDPTAKGSKGFEKFKHPLIRAPWLSSQSPAHPVLEVVVAHGHRVGIAKRSLGDLRNGPDPDSGQFGQTYGAIGEGHLGNLAVRITSDRFRSTFAA
jgi:hypothetical protein